MKSFTLSKLKIRFFYFTSFIGLELSLCVHWWLMQAVTLLVAVWKTRPCKEQTLEKCQVMYSNLLVKLQIWKRAYIQCNEKVFAPLPDILVFRTYLTFKAQLHLLTN